MGNLGKLFIGLCILASPILQSCGSKIEAAKSPPVQREQNLGGEALRGILTTTNGEVLNLADDSNTPQILFFASETCSICRHETQSLVGIFQNRGLPTNIKLYTVLIGSTLQDARDWQREIGATWPVASDLQGTLFREYCSELQTPCILLRHPIHGKKKLIGEHSIEEFEQQTGIWTYL